MQESIAFMQADATDKHLPDRVPPQTRIAVTKDADTPFLMTMMFGETKIGAATQNVSASLVQAFREMGEVMRHYLAGHYRG
jgi:hypothetical protein